MIYDDIRQGDIIYDNIWRYVSMYGTMEWCKIILTGTWEYTIVFADIV